MKCGVSFFASTLVAGAVLFGSLTASAAFANERSPAQTEYAATLWSFLTRAGSTYQSWPVAEAVIEIPYGPFADANSKSYRNQIAANSPSLPTGSIIVTEHFAEGQADPVGVTIWYKQAEGYDSSNGDWYWAYFTSTGKLAKASIDNTPHDKRGFVVIEEDGRLWVLKIGTQELADFLVQGELSRHIIRPSAGPAGKTLKSDDASTLDDYLTSKRGFMTKMEDGRLWIIAKGSQEEADFKKHGELAKHVIHPGAGPRGMTLKAPDRQTIFNYLTAVEGFDVVFEDGRAWVFTKGSPEYEQVKKGLEPAKSVTRPSAGPGRVTLRAVDTETLDAYQKAVQ